MNEIEGKIQVAAKAEVWISQKAFDKYKPLLDAINEEETIYHIMQNAKD